MKIISLFSGAGGLDQGFERAGFEIVFANEYDKAIWETYRANFPTTHLDTRSITAIAESDLPKADGLIGGPPCQSWSEAGAHRGIEDERGQLFFEYLRVLKHVKPRFFLAENVSGIVSSRHLGAFEKILRRFTALGYEVSHKLLNAADYGVPQDRERVIVVGIRSDLNRVFEFPDQVADRVTLRDAIGGMPSPMANPSLSTTMRGLAIANHEYLVGGFSSMFMSRNRVRPWARQSFTIQAGARHAPLHPSAPTMEKIGEDKFRFVVGKESSYRRLSVRECARIQTFPDSHQLVYDRIIDGYKMIGNAVPVEFAFRLAKQIRDCVGGRKSATERSGRGIARCS
ncbi:MAG: DNA cytosine methyltransferase [Phycisphaerales bacterium]|nr:DNA cytosine methyltransferase [Phycisphaerales bacterium]